MDLTLQLKQQEEIFIQACIHNEQWAQKKLYEDFYGGMKGVCLRYANNDMDAQDILHEGFIKVFKHIGKYQPGTSLSAWIRRIMVNTSIDYYRKRTRRRTEDMDAAYDKEAGLPSAVSDLTVKEIILSIQCLTPAYRMVFNLYVMEGYSHREISEILGITESTSRSNLVKARIKLKALLAKKDIRYDR
jgi:RNA polymerase sigma-70 factor (ECF subfamily)